MVPFFRRGDISGKRIHQTAATYATKYAAGNYYLTCCTLADAQAYPYMDAPVVASPE